MDDRLEQIKKHTVHVPQVKYCHVCWLIAEVERLRKALKPIKKSIDRHNAQGPREIDLHTKGLPVLYVTLTMSDEARILRALEPSDGKQDR